VIPEVSSHAVVWALRHPGEALEGGVKPDPQVRQGPDEPAVLACSRCHEAITTEADWLEVSGAREHTFMNPHGFCFRIGCFGAARSLVASGDWSDEWSWFPPCAWQVQQCARCGEHLGWLFRSPERRFYGLVLDRLVRLGS
jgi:hypothetical protein